MGFALPSADVAPVNTSVTQVEHQGSPLLGTAGVLGAVAFLGLLLIILVPGPISALGFGLAGFGAAGTMALALVTEKGRWPAKLPSAMLLGALMGLGCAGLSFALQEPGAASLPPSPGDLARVVAAESGPLMEATVPPDDRLASTDTPSAGAGSQPTEAAVAPPTPPASSDPARKPAASSSARESEKRSSRRSEREASRKARAPSFPGLSASDLSDLEESASATKPEDMVSERRGSRSERAASSRSRDRSYKPSDEIARTDDRSSPDRRSSSSERSTPLVAGRSSGRSSSAPRSTPPKADRKKAESKSSGGAPNQFIIKTIIGSNKAIKRCISSQRARDPDMSGKFYVKFKIAPSGQVSRARITTSRYAGTALDTCISREVNALRFPPFDGKTQNITYPLVVIAD